MRNSAFDPSPAASHVDTPKDPSHKIPDSLQQDQVVLYIEYHGTAGNCAEKEGEGDTNGDQQFPGFDMVSPDFHAQMDAEIGKDPGQVGLSSGRCPGIG